jgi:predicted nucleic acid-binding protein
MPLHPSQVVIADAGPLIALARLGLLNVLWSLYETVVIPSIVWQETTSAGNFVETEAILTAKQNGWLSIATEGPEVELEPASTLWMVDAGERAALLLALDLRKRDCEALLILDDAAARSGAKNFKLAFIGTLGVLLRAKQVGLISEVVPLVVKLQSSGYFLSNSLIEAIAEQAGEPLPRH